jgi:hypothetical protein
MKTSIRLSLAATLVAGFGVLSGAAMAATATGNASATVLTPIAVSETTALNFGTLSANASGGSVLITAAGVRTPSGTVVVTSGAFSAAAFTVTGTGNATFGITYPSAFNVSNGANTMSVTVAGASTGTLASGTVVVPVGGTLTVGAAQAAGAYTGTYPLTVEYN